MTLYDFKRLPEKEQISITWDRGDFVFDYLIGNKHFALYQLFDFYSEVLYDTDKNTVIAIRSFTQGVFLDQHLEQIDISVFFKI